MYIVYVCIHVLSTQGIRDERIGNDSGFYIALFPRAFRTVADLRHISRAAIQRMRNC